MESSESEIDILHWGYQRTTVNHAHYTPDTNGRVLMSRLERLYRIKQIVQERRSVSIRYLLDELDISSVVRQTDWNLLSRARAFTTFARMSEARAVQMNGLGSRLWFST